MSPALHRPLALALAGSLGAVYAGALGHTFLPSHDDDLTVLENPAVQAPLPAAIELAFTTRAVGAWAPLHLLTHVFDRTLFGEWAGGYVLVNVLLHALAAWLVAALAARLGATPLAAAVAAFVFALHPVQVEAVAWVSQRKTVLSTVLLLASLHAWVTFARVPPGRRALSYAGALLAGVAALLSKPAAVVLPLALLLLDTALGRLRPARRALLEQAPFALAAAAVVAVTVLGKGEVASTVSEAGHTRTIGLLGLAWHGGGPLATLLTSATILPRYLGLLLWPAELSAVYLPEVHRGVDLAVVGALALLAALVAAALASARPRPRLALGIGVFLAGLLPVAQLVPQVTLMNDRYLYLPLVGGALAAGELAGLLRERLPGRAAPLLVGALLALAGALGLTSRARVPVWENDLSLWSDAARKAPGSPHAHYNLGRALEARGEDDGALLAYRRAFELDPQDGLAAGNAAAVLLRRGAHAEALPLAEAAARLEPLALEAQFNLGYLAFVLGDLAAARARLERAAAIAPASCPARALLGHAHALAARPEAALATYAALPAGCGGAEVVLYAAFAAHQAGDLEAARTWLARAPREALLAALRSPGPTLVPLLDDPRSGAFLRAAGGASAP